MSVSSKPLSIWERQYSVLKHPALGTKVVRVDSGSRWIVLIGPIYLLFMKLWLQGAILSAFAGILLISTLGGGAPWSVILLLSMNLFLIFKAGRWLEKDMVKHRGYELLGTCNARSEEEAMAIIQEKGLSPEQRKIEFKPYGLGAKILGGIGVCAAVLFVMVILPVMLQHISGPVSLPTCESDTADDQVKEAIKNGPMNRILNVEILALKEIETVSTTEEKVVCTARGITNAGDKKFAYAFEWANKDRGEIITRVEEIR